MSAWRPRSPRGGSPSCWDLQPTGYQFAAKQMGLGEVSVQYQVVTKTKTPALQVIDLERTVEDQEESCALPSA